MDLWSTCLKLFDSGALRSMTADLPRLLSQSTKCATISTCSPSISYLDIAFNDSAFFKSLISID